MILIIRISGIIGIPSAVKETLFRLGLRRKYSAILMKPSLENEKLLLKIRNYVAYGDIKKEMLIDLIEKRGKPIKKGDKIDAQKIVEELDKKSLSALGLKPFFSLQPLFGA